MGDLQGLRGKPVRVSRISRQLGPNPPASPVFVPRQRRLSFFAPDAVFDGRVELSEGRAAIRRVLDDWFGYFAELRMEGEEFVVLDEGVVLAVVSQESRLVGVDRQVHQREGWVICWSADGLLVRLTTRADIDEARAAAERIAESRG